MIIACGVFHGGQLRWLTFKTSKKKHEKEFQDVEAYLENLATEHNMSEAELNEFMWFSLDDYLIENNYMDSEGVWLD